MAGFVGSNAKKRKRRNYIIVFSAIILLLLFFYTPEFSINQDTPIPDDSILPDPNEEISSLSSSIEDLQLTVFQKDQKISFRDKEIKKLKNEIKELKINYENVNSNYSLIKKDFEDLVNEKKNKDTIDVNSKEIEDLNKKIKNLNKKNNLNLSTIKELEDELQNLKIQYSLSNSDNEALKIEYKKVVADNIKMKNFVDNLEQQIQNQKNKIKELLDTSHHNQ